MFKNSRNLKCYDIFENVKNYFLKFYINKKLIDKIRIGNKYVKFKLNKNK